MKILGVDPGYTQSAYVLYDVDKELPISFATVPNADLLVYLDRCTADQIAVEHVASYGMSVGREVFATCVFVGRIIERWERWIGRSAARAVYRADVKLHLTHSRRSKDANVRQALIDKFGPGKDVAIGKKATPGPLYGLTGDCWAALAVAITAAETEDQGANGKGTNDA